MSSSVSVLKDFSSILDWNILDQIFGKAGFHLIVVLEMLSDIYVISRVLQPYLCYPVTIYASSPILALVHSNGIAEHTLNSFIRLHSM